MRIVAANDGVLQQERDNGLTIPNGLTGTTYGGTLRWRAPLSGLMFGITQEFEHHTGEVYAGPIPGTFDSHRFSTPYYFGSYERKKWMFAGEYNRFGPDATTTLEGQAPSMSPSDERNWYVMTSYKLTAKLTGGAYYSYTTDRKAPLDTNRFQKDWDFAGRYDFNSYLYLKVEQHVVDGTAIGFDSSDNPAFPTPKFNMTLLKLGASF
jgi:hypothetical protein